MATNTEGQQIMNSVRLAFLNLERRDIFWSVINDLKNEPYYNGNIFESANMAEQLNKNDDTYNRVISLGLNEGWIDEDYKDCSHKFECGCGKQSCLEMGLDNCDEDFCDNESCRHYYNHRNDNCDCGRCGYCDSDLDE